jgi:hypothetical protein
LAYHTWKYVLEIIEKYAYFNSTFTFDIAALHSPFLASFIKSLEFPDVLDAVQVKWLFTQFILN